MALLTKYEQVARNAAKQIKTEPSINKILGMFDVLSNSDAKTKINAHSERPLDIVVSKIKAK